MSRDPFGARLYRARICRDHAPPVVAVDSTDCAFIECAVEVGGYAYEACLFDRCEFAYRRGSVWLSSCKLEGGSYDLAPLKGELTIMQAVVYDGDDLKSWLEVVVGRELPDTIHQIHGDGFIISSLAFGRPEMAVKAATLEGEETH